MTKSELKEMIRKYLREELAKADYLKESADSREFVVTYRLKSWPASYKNTELLLDAEDEASAKEAFLDYMFDPDAYDEDDYMPSDEDEIEIISIKASGKLAEGAFSGGVAGDNRLGSGKVSGLGVSMQPDHKSYLKRLKNKNPDLVSTTTIKAKDLKSGMLTNAGQVKEANVQYSDYYGKDMVYVMHTNDWDYFEELDADMEVMLDPDDNSKPFTGDYKELLKKGLKESAEVAEEEDELEEGIFGNKYKGMDILTYRGNGKDEPIAIAKTGAANYPLVHFQNAHAKKNNNDKSDYQLVAATDKAVKRYKKALKSVPDVTTNLPQWVKQYIDDSKAQASRDFQNKQQEKEREIQARKEADRKHYQKLGAAKNPDDDYVYVKGNGSGTYKYRESLGKSRQSRSFYEEFKLYESLWDDITKPAGQTRSKRTQLKEAVMPSDNSFDQAELKACLGRVNTNASKYASRAEIDAISGSICVKLSEEDLKKALRIGSRGGYTSGEGMTIPAQLVDMVSLEITRAEDEEDGACICLVELYGENEKTGESTHEYNNGDVPFVGDTTIPGTPIDSDEEFIEYIKTEVFPNADRIAHDIINETWNKFGLNDYEGITDYNYDTGISGLDSIKDSDDADEWSEFLKQADSLLYDLVSASGNADYDDGDGYWQTEYDVWCFRYLYHFRMLNNIEKVEQLCNEYSNKLPNVEFYFSVPEDGDDDVCEIGYTATRV